KIKIQRTSFSSSYHYRNNTASNNLETLQVLFFIWRLANLKQHYSTKLAFTSLCPSFNRSFTFFTGLKVASGTSTNRVFQLCIAPFQRPGCSNAFNGRPS